MRFHLMIDNHVSKYTVNGDSLVGFDNNGNRTEFHNGSEDLTKWSNLSSIEVFDELDNVVIINQPANTITGICLIP